MPFSHSSRDVSTSSRPDCSHAISAAAAWALRSLATFSRYCSPGRSGPASSADSVAIVVDNSSPASAKNLSGSSSAANASSISDGAAALVMTRASVADKLGLKVVAKVVSHAAHAHEPGLFTTAPVPAMQKALKKAGWRVDDVDLFEVNEAFAVVAMIAERELSIDRAKLNVNGGACALGHPIGASGARIVITLLGALKKYGLKRGVASLCIGGGEATALAVEML